MTVYCGQNGCRKVLKPQDFDLYYSEWDTKIKNSIQKIFNVEQPLLPLVDENTRKELDEFFSNPEKYKSVYSLKLKTSSSEVESDF